MSIFDPYLQNTNIPIVGQPVADYAIGIPIFIPDDPRSVAALTDSVANTKAKKAKGDIAVIFGDPPKQIRCFSYEEFVQLIFGTKTEANDDSALRKHPSDAPLKSV